MEIITHGINKTKFIFKCGNCQCEFKATYEELHKPSGLDASRFYIHCPECNTFTSTTKKEVFNLDNV